MEERNILEKLFGGLVNGNEENTPREEIRKPPEENTKEIPKPQEERVEIVPVLNRSEKNPKKLTMVVPKYKIVYTAPSLDELTSLATNGKFTSWDDIVATTIDLVFANGIVYVVVEGDNGSISIPTGVLARIIWWCKNFRQEYNSLGLRAQIDEVSVSDPKSPTCYKPMGIPPKEVWIASEPLGADVILINNKDVVGLAPEDINFIIEQLRITAMERDIAEPLKVCGIRLF